MSQPMTKTNETKILIVTETVSYEFIVPASMAEDGDSLKRFFAGHPEPWMDANFAAVVNRNLVTKSSKRSSSTDHAS